MNFTCLARTSPGVRCATAEDTSKWNKERVMLSPVAMRRVRGITKYVKNTTKIAKSIWKKGHYTQHTTTTTVVVFTKVEAVW